MYFGIILDNASKAIKNSKIAACSTFDKICWDLHVDFFVNLYSRKIKILTNTYPNPRRKGAAQEKIFGRFWITKR